MKFSAPTIFALLTPVPGALASLQSPPFTISSSTSYPANPTLDNQPLISFSFHPGGFFYPVLGAGTALIGYLNGSDTDNPITDLTLEFDNVPGWEGSPFGFDFDPNAGAAPYTTVTLQYGPGNKGMNVENGELRYDGEGSAPGLFFGEILVAATVSIDR